MNNLTTCERCNKTIAIFEQSEHIYSQHMSLLEKVQYNKKIEAEMKRFSLPY